VFGGRERAACDDVFEAGSVVMWVSWSFSIYICRNRLNVVCECPNHSSTPLNESTEYKTSEFSDPKPLPQTGAGARFIVPVRAIQGAAHLIPIKEKDGCGDKRWFLNNTVGVFNLAKYAYI
jgi:hypothetical protein